MPQPCVFNRPAQIAFSVRLVLQITFCFPPNTSAAATWRKDSRMEAIAADHVTKRFDTVVAVSDLNLHVEQGAVFGLLGPNGAGKTTTLRMIMHILVPDEGSV